MNTNLIENILMFPTQKQLDAFLYDFKGYLPATTLFCLQSDKINLDKFVKCNKLVNNQNILVFSKKSFFRNHNKNYAISNCVCDIGINDGQVYVERGDLIPANFAKDFYIKVKF